MKMNHGYAIVCMCLCLGLSSGTYAEDQVKKDPKDYLATIHPRVLGPDRFIQKDFVISGWMDPALDDAAYKDFADANFTVVLALPRAWNLTERVSKSLKLCKKYGLKAILWCGDFPQPPKPHLPLQFVEEDKNDPTCLGYWVVDEPSSTINGDIRKWVDEIHRQRPGKLTYVNLLPIHAPAGADSYEEYLARFINEVDPDVLCFDHYPIFRPDLDGRDGYCQNLSAAREFSLAANIPFWNFFNTTAFYLHTDPTEAQLRWQLHASIAYGAKGVLYFIYFPEVASGKEAPEFKKGNGVLTPYGQKTRHYYQAQRLNAEIKNLGPTLMQLTSTGVYRLRPKDDAAAVLKGTPIQNITLTDPRDPPNDYLVGVYQHSDGRKAVFIQNYRYAFTAWPTVTFNVPLDQVREICKKTGKEIPVRDDSPGAEGLQISLDSAEGRLFLLSSKPKSK